MGKILRVISLTTTLTILIVLLVLNMTIKDATNEIIEETIKALVPQEVTEKIEDANDWIQEVLNNKEIIEKIKEKTGYEVTEEFVKEKLEEIDINEVIEKQEQKLTEEEKTAWEIIKFLSNVKLKVILIIAIIFELLIIMLAEKSLYKWIKSFAWSLSLSGVGLFLLSTWIREKLNVLLHTSNITLSAIINPAIVLAITGIIIRLIYMIIVRIIKANQEKENEVEEDAIS